MIITLYYDNLWLHWNHFWITRDHTRALSLQQRKLHWLVTQATVPPIVATSSLSGQSSLLAQAPLIGAESPPLLAITNPHQLLCRRNLVHVGPTFPLVPGKLIKRIEHGCFIKMDELLSESLGYQSLDDDLPSAKRPKLCTVSRSQILLNGYSTSVYIIYDHHIPQAPL